MLCCVVSCFVALCCVALRCVLSCCVVLRCVVLCCVALCCVVLWCVGAVLRCVPLCCVVLCCVTFDRNEEERGLVASLLMFLATPEDVCVFGKRGAAESMFFMILHSRRGFFYFDLCLWTENGQLREHLRFEICRVYLKCSCIREDVREFGRRGGVRESIMRACESLDVSVMTNRGCLRQHRHEEERGLVAPFWCVSICDDGREVF